MTSLYESRGSRVPPDAITLSQHSMPSLSPFYGADQLSHCRTLSNNTDWSFGRRSCVRLTSRLGITFDKSVVYCRTDDHFVMFITSVGCGWGGGGSEGRKFYNVY